MRIISGIYGGRKIELKLPGSIRPTMDSARESIFNILANYINFENAVILDIFAGTGAMGFEAISRGAGKAVFIEKSKKSIAVIKEVSVLLGIDSSQCEIIQADALNWLKAQEKSMERKLFDVIFCDPPYHLRLANAVLVMIENSAITNPGAIVVIEHGTAELLMVPTNWKLIKTKQFGETVVDFITKESD